MLNITLTDEARTVLHALLEKEDDKACFRLREFTSGCGASCNRDIVRTLAVTLDTPEEEDLTVDVGGMRFVMDEIFLANYGNTFFIALGKNAVPTVTSLSPLFR